MENITHWKFNLIPSSSLLIHDYKFCIEDSLELELFWKTNVSFGIFLMLLVGNDTFW